MIQETIFWFGKFTIRSALALRRDSYSQPKPLCCCWNYGWSSFCTQYQFIEKFKFSKRAFPAEYGDVTSGVFDVNFRSGNFDTTEITAQIHATGGLELEIEGPLKKEVTKAIW